MKRIEKMTEAAKTAIRSAGTSRQGAPLRGRFSVEVMTELRTLKMIGKLDGLTREGSYAYLDLQDADELALGW